MVESGFSSWGLTFPETSHSWWGHVSQHLDHFEFRMIQCHNHCVITAEAILLQTSCNCRRRGRPRVWVQGHCQERPGQLPWSWVAFCRGSKTSNERKQTKRQTHRQKTGWQQWGFGGGEDGAEGSSKKEKDFWRTVWWLQEGRGDHEEGKWQWKKYNKQSKEMHSPSWKHIHGFFFFLSNPSFSVWLESWN